MQDFELQIVKCHGNHLSCISKFCTSLNCVNSRSVNMIVDKVSYRLMSLMTLFNITGKLLKRQYSESKDNFN